MKNLKSKTRNNFKHDQLFIPLHTMFQSKLNWYNADRVAVIVQFPCPVPVMSGLDYYRYRIGIISNFDYQVSSMYYQVSSMYYQVSSMQDEVSSMQDEVSSMQDEVFSTYYEVSSMYVEVSSMYVEVFSMYYQVSFMYD